jgi:hypothetical protein
VVPAVISVRVEEVMDTGANVGGDGGPRLQMLPELVGRWRRRFYEEGRRGFFWPGTISVTTDRRLQVARVLIAMSNEGPVSREGRWS